MLCPVLKLAQKLISIPSISPVDLGCQKIIMERLSAIGIKVETINIKDTCNFWATRGHGKTLTFLGHTDVVKPGKICNWKTLPFHPVITNGMLFGRGAADMKGALAAMVIAVERFVQSYPNHSGRLSFLITSDEESSAVNGTKKVVEKLKIRQEVIDYCLVGEPSSSEFLGDVIKNGRRGSITARLTVYGVQGHVAYPTLVNNPIHKILPFLISLTDNIWSSGNEFFPPTQVQIVNFQAGYGSNNIVPGELSVEFNFRFGNDISVIDLKNKVEKLLLKHCLQYTITWNVSAKPFFTQSGVLLKSIVAAIKKVNNIQPKVLTTGGTSDGRFLSCLGSEVIELGLINKTIHQVNECVEVSDLHLLSVMYEYVMKKIFILIS